MNAPQFKKELSFPSLRIGSLEVRLAQTPLDIEAAQRLRYRIFYDEMGASPLSGIGPPHLSDSRDFDDFDDLCDHILVVDHEYGQAVVGTYRLIRREAALRRGHFYSATEYNISILEAHKGEILEVGRSCIDANYRTRPTMSLLWRGIVEYMAIFDIPLLFGCASFSGTNPQVYAHALSYLYHFHLAPKDCRPVALPKFYVDMQLIEKDKIDLKKAKNQLPSLIKGYLRVGSSVGDGAVIDTQFNAIDVCIVLKANLVTTRYSNHYRRHLLHPGRKNVF